LQKNSKCRTGIEAGVKRAARINSPDLVPRRAAAAAEQGLAP